MTNLPDVLIIEDQKEYANPLKECLNTSNRYHVIGIIDNVSDACKMVATKRPSIIFVDLQLKNNDFGLAILQHLIDEKIEPLPLRLIITSFASTQIMNKAKKLSDFHFFKNPFEPSKILFFLDTIFYYNPPVAHLPQAQIKPEQSLAQQIEQILQPFHFLKHQKGYNYLLKLLIENYTLSQKNLENQFSLALENTAFNLDSDPNTINMGIDRLIKRTFKNHNDDYLMKVYPHYQATKKAPTPKNFVNTITQQMKIKS